MVLVVKNQPSNAGDIRDMGSIPGMGRSPGGGHGNPLQCSCLENPMDRGSWWATVHRVVKSQTRLKRLSMLAGMGSRKTVRMNLFAGQQWRRRHREQTCEHGGEKGDGETNGESSTETHTMLGLLLLLLSHSSRVRLCATPKTAAHQAPPALGFSRQEHYYM